MARVVEPTKADEREALKSEIKKEMRQENFRRRLAGYGGCSLVVLVVLAVPAFFVAMTLARTGFFKVPFFSERYYKPSLPSRRVIALVGSNADNIVTAESAKAKFDPHTNLLKLSFTEAELTTIVQEGVRKAKEGELPFPVRDVQVTIDDKNVEVFAVSPQKAGDATVRARFVPSVDRGTITFRVDEIVIGDLVLPKWLSQTAFNAVGKLLSRAVTGQSENIGTLFSIEYTKGVLRFFIMPKSIP